MRRVVISTQGVGAEPTSEAHNPDEHPMSSFRRRPRRGQARVKSPWRAPSPLPHPCRETAPGWSAPASLRGGIPFSLTHYELQASAGGLIIAPQTGARVPVPALVPWSEVCSVGAEGMAELADGSCGQVLEIEVSDGGWFIGDRVQRFVAPPSSLEPLVLAASAHRHLTDADSGEPDHQPGRWAAWSPWPRRASASSVPVGPASSPRAVADPQHGLGRRRIGPIAVGIMALVLLAGSTSTTFGSLAGGAARGSSRDQLNGTGNSLQALRQGRSVASPARRPASRHRRRRPWPVRPRCSPMKSSATPRTGRCPNRRDSTSRISPPWPTSVSMPTPTARSTRAVRDGTGTRARTWSTWSTGPMPPATGSCSPSPTSARARSMPSPPTPMRRARLSAALIAAVSAKNLDGVNFDFEGEGSGDQKGLTRLITQVSGGVARRQSPLAGDHGHLRQFGGRPRRLLRHRSPGAGGRRLLRDGLRHEQHADPESHGTPGRWGIHRHRGPPAVHRGGPPAEGDPRGALLRVRLAHDERNAHRPGHRRRVPTERRRHRRVRAIPPTGTRVRGRRGPRIRSGPSGTRRSSTTRRPWP